jgi:branched-chain amino acid transport system substrate-binding protein
MARKKSDDRWRSACVRRRASATLLSQIRSRDAAEGTYERNSVVGSDALAAELGENGPGVVVTQVVPFPRDPSVPVVKRYQEALKAAEPSAAPGFVSLEGYLVGRLAAAALGRLEGVPTREDFLGAVLSGAPIDIDGFRLKYGAGDNQGSDQVFLTVIGPDGAFRAVDRLKKG